MVPLKMYPASHVRKRRKIRNSSRILPSRLSYTGYYDDFKCTEDVTHDYDNKSAAFMLIADDEERD